VKEWKCLTSGIGRRTDCRLVGRVLRAFFSFVVAARQVKVVKARLANDDEAEKSYPDTVDSVLRPRILAPLLFIKLMPKPEYLSGISPMGGNNTP